MDGDRFVRAAGRRRGFTLIELLVVISIICMLMSIMLPSLTSAREQGKRVSCLANVRSLTQGWMMYAFENEDRLCSSDTDWDVPPGNHWVADGPSIPSNAVGGTAEAIRTGVLWPYTGGMMDLYKCKSDATDLLRSYAVSVAMNGTPDGAPVGSFQQWSGISQPSERMVFADASSRIPWIEGPFQPVKPYGADGLTWRVGITQNITARHGDGCNISLADGHCEYFKYRDPRTIALANDDRLEDKSARDNRDAEHFLELTECPFVMVTAPE